VRDCCLMLRHSTGYALAARGMDTRRLQHFLGHASITNTVRYTAMSPEPSKDIWRSFNVPAARCQSYSAAVTRVARSLKLSMNRVMGTK
jgi:streptogramin lyase